MKLMLLLFTIRIVNVKHEWNAMTASEMISIVVGVVEMFDWS